VLFLILSISIFLCADIGVSADSDTIRFAPLPMRSESVVRRQFAPFTDYISKKTGKKVHIYFYDNYRTVLNKLEKDELDLAFLGPLPYITLVNEYDKFIPLVRFLNKEGNSTYTCSVVTFGEELLKKEYVGNRKISLTQPYSTCGFLITSNLLKSVGINLSKSNYYYSGSHSASVMDVIKGKSYAGGLKTSIAKEYANLGAKIVLTSTPLPGFLLVANKSTMSKENYEKIKSILLELSRLKPDEHRRITAFWGSPIRYGAIDAKDKDYDCIRDKMKKHLVPEIKW